MYTVYTQGDTVNGTHHRNGCELLANLALTLNDGAGNHAKHAIAEGVCSQDGHAGSIVGTTRWCRVSVQLNTFQERAYKLTFHLIMRPRSDRDVSVLFHHAQWKPDRVDVPILTGGLAPFQAGQGRRFGAYHYDGSRHGGSSGTSWLFLHNLGRTYMGY